MSSVSVHFDNDAWGCFVQIFSTIPSTSTSTDADADPEDDNRVYSWEIDSQWYWSAEAILIFLVLSATIVGNLYFCVLGCKHDKHDNNNQKASIKIEPLDPESVKEDPEAPQPTVAVDSDSGAESTDTVSSSSAAREAADNNSNLFVHKGTRTYSISKYCKSKGQKTTTQISSTDVDLQ